MNPLVTQVHAQESRWKSEFAVLRQLCLESGLNEELKWGQACYDFNGGKVVLIHGFKNYCAVLFMKGALLEDPKGILIQQTKNVQSARQIRFASLAEINTQRAAVKRYIKEAIAVEKSGCGRGWTMTPRSPKPFMHSLPEGRKVICCISPGQSDPQRAALAWTNRRRESCADWDSMIEPV